MGLSLDFISGAVRDKILKYFKQRAGIHTPPAKFFFFFLFFSAKLYLSCFIFFL